MRQKRLLHIDSVKVHSNLLQAFEFFLSIIWQDVDIVDIYRPDESHYTVELSMPDSVKGELIMHLWKDWTVKLMHEMYAIRN